MRVYLPPAAQITPPLAVGDDAVQQFFADVDIDGLAVAAAVPACPARWPVPAGWWPAGLLRLVPVLWSPSIARNRRFGGMTAPCAKAGTGRLASATGGPSAARLCPLMADRAEEIPLDTLLAILPRADRIPLMALVMRSTIATTPANHAADCPLHYADDAIPNRGESSFQRGQPGVEAGNEAGEKRFHACAEVAEKRLCAGADRLERGLQLCACLRQFLSNVGPESSPILLQAVAPIVQILLNLRERVSDVLLQSLDVCV